MLLVAGFFVLISYSNRSNLYCSSINLIESLEVVTPFCVISGELYLNNIKSYIFVCSLGLD